MTDRYILHYAPDNASLIVRLALDELGLDFDTRLVDRARTAQRSPEYLRLNPAGRIPTLETPDGPISETAAILLWLADRHGRLAPPPGDPARAPFLNWLLFLSNTVHADMLSLFYVHRYGPEPAWPGIRLAARKRITRSLGVLHNEALPRLPGWLCHESPSILDLYLAAILRWLALYPADYERWFDLASYPAFHDMCARLDSRPAVRRLCEAEGMAPHPFTAPQAPVPHEGSAL